jgi:hypothetical protein
MDVQLVKVTDDIRKLTDHFNKPPRETFKRHHPSGWNKDKPLTEDQQRENELYDAWLASMKPGDVVYYDYFEGWHGGRRFTKFKSRTKTGMIRLEDGKLVEQNGRVKGESHYLQPYTAEYRLFDQRKGVLAKLRNRTFDHLTNEGLVYILQAIERAESIVLQKLDGGE